MSRLSARGGVWDRRRFSVLKRDGWQCVSCGATGPGAKLEVHHKRSLVSGGDPIPDSVHLVTLCQPCHIERHREGRYGVQATEWSRHLRDLRDAE